MSIALSALRFSVLPLSPSCPPNAAINSMSDRRPELCDLETHRTGTSEKKHRKSEFKKVRRHPAVCSPVTSQKSWCPQVGKQQACLFLPGTADWETKGKLNPAESEMSPCSASWVALGTQTGTWPEGKNKKLIPVIFNKKKILVGQMGGKLPHNFTTQPLCVG